MRILLDARLLDRGGIGRYLRELASRWLREDSVREVHFLGRGEELEEWLEETDPRGIATWTSWSDPPFSVRGQLRWAASLRRLARDADVTFFPHYDVPLLRHPSPSVVTIHDLTHFLVPSAFPRLKRLAGRFLLKGAVRRAGAIVTVSQNSARDLAEWATQSSGKVSVVHPGVSPCFRPLDGGELDRARRRWSEYRPFILAVGAPKPHKNLDLAVRLLARLRDRSRDLRLLVAGVPIRRETQRLRALASELGVEDALVPLGPRDDSELVELYSAAELFVFPSLNEGFGLPVLEAMACGTPVLASDRASIPEVAGEAAVLADPEDAAAWEAGARRLLDAPEERQSLVSKGLERAERFSWDRSARETLRILRAVANASA